jgi:hypothetical protein
MKRFDTFDTAIGGFGLLDRDIRYVDVPMKESLVMVCTFKGKKYQNATLSIMVKLQHEG